MNTTLWLNSINKLPKSYYFQNPPLCNGGFLYATHPLGVVHNHTDLVALVV